jgi:hypothetical protein
MLPSGSEVINGGTQTESQTGDLISLLSFFGKQANKYILVLIYAK